MSRRALLLALPLILLSAALGSPQDGASPRLAVLTYNAGLLRAGGMDLVPAVEARGARLPAGIAALAWEQSLDLILLEEVWEEGHARAVIEALAPLGYGFVRPAERNWTGIGSGLLLAVRRPLAVTRWAFIPFTRSSFPDSLARKGVLAAVVEGPEPGERFVVLGTHMVAIDTKAGVPAVPAQVEAHAFQAAQVVSEMEAWTLGGRLPALILGDFNVGPGYVQGNYDMIAAAPGVSSVDAALGVEPPVTWDPGNPVVAAGEAPSEPPAAIDHVFLRGGTFRSWKPLAVRRVLDAPVPGIPLPAAGASESAGVPLSDHYGLLAEVELEPRP
jgi:endonuclease/exonuclease/phosphatase family metal-dependent hydrolase